MGYGLNITRKFLVLLVKTAGISHMIYYHLLPYVRCLGFIGLSMREIVTFMRNRNGHASSGRESPSHYIIKKAWDVLHPRASGNGTQGLAHNEDIMKLEKKSQFPINN